ncbi:MAG: hypothetical protein Q4C67_05810, partial [Deinococcus sp.]|nr:hypothetical protein [Deinococcus sp.]
MKRRLPKKDSPEVREIMDAAATLRRELTQVREELRRGQDREQTRPPVIHETPATVQPMTVGGEPALTPALVPQEPTATSTVGLPVGKVRQGLEVYALHELDQFEEAMQSLAVDVRAAEVQLIWLPDQADRKGRQGLQVYPVATLGGRSYTLGQHGAAPAVVEVQGQSLRLLHGGEAVQVGPAGWAKLDEWRNFGGEPLRWLARLRGNSWSWLLWVAVMIAAFNIWWVLGIAWLFGASYLFGTDGVRPYRQGYFEDHTPPDSTKELLWHLSTQRAAAASLLPGVQRNPEYLRPSPVPATVSGDQAAPASATARHSSLLPQRPSEHLPDDLAAGLRMVRERVADLPEEDVLTADGYRLRGLAERCEEAARLYLRLPAGSEAADTAAAEVRAMLQESLEALAGAGSRTQQQQ